MIHRVGLLHFWMVLLFFPWNVKAVQKVVVSIKPLHSLVSGVMEGVGEPNLLLEGNTSVHVYSMRPSEVSMLQQAELFFLDQPAVGDFSRKTTGKPDPLHDFGGDDRYRGTSNSSV